MVRVVTGEPTSTLELAPSELGDALSSMRLCPPSAQHQMQRSLSRLGQLTPVQAVVALVTITLFVPCVANFFVIVKERGARTALAMTAFIFPFAFLIGGIVNQALRGVGLQ